MKQRESITGTLSEEDYAKVEQRVRLLALTLTLSLTLTLTETPLSEEDYAKVEQRVRLLAAACILPAYYLCHACTHSVHPYTPATPDASTRQDRQQTDRQPCVQPEPRTSADDSNSRVACGPDRDRAGTHASHPPATARLQSLAPQPLSPTTYQVRAAFPGLE